MESFCSQCGRYKDTISKKMCDVCRKKRRERAARLEQKRKEKDLCTKCGKKLDRSGARCKRCLRKYRLKKDPVDNRCTECNKNLIENENSIHCDGCKSKLDALDKLKKVVIFTQYGNKCQVCDSEDLDCLVFRAKEAITLNAFIETPDYDEIIKDNYPDTHMLECANCLYKRASNVER